MPKIKQNKNEYFIFHILNNNYSLDIEFNHSSKLNYENLFLILKCYVLHEELLIDSMYVNSSEVGSSEEGIFNINIFHNIKINNLKKMTFFEFKEWFIDLKEKDYEYIKNLKYYGFRIIFNKNSIFWSKKEIYPLYPWNINFKKKLINKNIKIENWLYYKNKKLYYHWKKKSNKNN